MRFDQPVGALAARDGAAWAGGWVDANPIGAKYVNPATGLGAYHTGADLNCNTPAWDVDAHSPVYASADGVVMFAGAKPVWMNIIVIKHMVDGRAVFTRYAHVENMVVNAGQSVKRGQQIAQTGNANGTMAYHLHFDVAFADLEQNPGDWPGLDLARLQRDYTDPQAWINTHREEKQTMADTKMVVQGTGGSALNVRASGALNGVKLGGLAEGEPVVVVETQGDWSKVLLFSTERGSRAYGWVNNAYLKAVGTPAPTPQPSARAQVLLGVNVLNRHEEVALPLAQRGCRFFMVLNNPGFASRLKNEYPDAIVMARRHWNKQMPSVDAAISGMDGCHDPRLIYTGINEGDECGQGGSGNNINVDEIRKRAEFDIALARKIKEISGAKYAAGTFSMGTPEFNSPAICDAIRALYAPHYNSGLIWWDHHLYSPLIDHIYLDNELQWFETRWQFLFTKCGFNPASASRVVCSETGEDEGGWGGFPAHGRNDDQVASWGRRFIEVQSRPLVVGGVAYPSPFVGGAMFQVGNREDWNGYNVEGLLGKISWK